MGMFRRISGLLKGWSPFAAASAILFLLAVPLLLSAFFDPREQAILSIPAGWFIGLVVLPLCIPVIVSLAWSIADRNARR